jgi:hypothetical protein
MGDCMIACVEEANETNLHSAGHGAEEQTYNLDRKGGGSAGARANPAVPAAKTKPPMLITISI